MGSLLRQPPLAIMPSNSVPELQQKLFKRMGIDSPDLTQDRKPRRVREPLNPHSRKGERRAQRAQKKAHRYSRQPPPVQISQRRNPRTAQELSSSRQHTTAAKRKSDDSEDGLLLQDDGGCDDDDEPPSSPSGSEKGAGLLRAGREKLAQDDAEIEELERKLGIQKGRKSLPKAFKDDGLDDLLDDLGGDAPPSESEAKKRKHDYDDWLSSKRRKTPRRPEDAEMGDDEVNDKDMLSDADDIDESLDGLDSDAGSADAARPRQRENPYIAPTTAAVAAKYVPPSLRKASGPEDEGKGRLRKQIQGQINRLTDTNILSIVRSIDEIYQRNARGDVTELLTDAVMAQVCKPASLPDQFFVLTGGFCAAIYKTVGSSFGSHLVRRVVKDFGDEYDRVGKEGGGGKEASNTITLLTQLYLFDVVSCKIVFDYMERLLENLSEINVELLLRVCRMTGRLLRRDDPQALKHVSGVLAKAVSKLGYANVSARTKFMIETINDLRDSKPKAKGMDSAVVSEHVLRMKKRLGELKSQSRRLDGLAAMGMGLDDIQGADTFGKWWLVGASVPAYREAAGKRAKGDPITGKGNGEVGGGTTDDEDMDLVLPDYPSKARAQGLVTMAQVAIFTALMSANSHEQGYRQYANLKLKKDEQLEIARVLVQCVGSEAQYNEYYALVGRQACANSRVRFALQDRLWKILRGLGESLFGEEAEEEDEETADSERMKDERRAYNVARFYASLVADGALSFGILKPLELALVKQRASVFMEWFMISLLQECRGKGAKEDARVEKVFGRARELPSLAAGTHWFLMNRVRKSKLVGPKEAKRLDRVREKAQSVVQAVAIDAE